MAHFINIPPLRIGRNGHWLLIEDCAYVSDKIGKVVVPSGFETDLASIPRIFTPLFPKNGRHRAAAIVHDYLCRTNYEPRSMADKVFLEAMKVLEVPRWRRWSMFAAVRTMTFFMKGKR